MRRVSSRRLQAVQVACHICCLPHRAWSSRCRWLAAPRPRPCCGRCRCNNAAQVQREDGGWFGRRHVGDRQRRRQRLAALGTAVKQGTCRKRWVGFVFCILLKGRCAYCKNAVAGQQARRHRLRAYRLLPGRRLRCAACKPSCNQHACMQAGKQARQQGSRNANLREGWASVAGVGSLSRTVRGPTAVIAVRPADEVFCYLRQGSRLTSELEAAHPGARNQQAGCGGSGGGDGVAPPRARGRIRPIKRLFESPANVCGVYRAQQTRGQRNAGRTHCACGAAPGAACQRRDPEPRS